MRQEDLNEVMWKSLPQWRKDQLFNQSVEQNSKSLQQLKAGICDCDEGIAWRTESRNNPLSNIVFCAACGRKLSAV